MEEATARMLCYEAGEVFCYDFLLAIEEAGDFLNGLAEILESGSKDEETMVALNLVTEAMTTFFKKDKRLRLIVKDMIETNAPGLLEQIRSAEKNKTNKRTIS